MSDKEISNLIDKLMRKGLDRKEAIETAYKTYGRGKKHKHLER